MIRLISLLLVLLAVSGCKSEGTRFAEAVSGGDVAAGKKAVRHYGCASCHQVPGVQEARSHVGPDLSDFANRIYIAGVMENTPQNLVQWIKDPKAVDPKTAMPETGVTEEDARNIAAFLYTFR